MKTLSLAALLSAFLLAGGAVAAPPAFEEAKLAANPSDGDLMNAFPETARGQNIDAQVTLRCTIDAAGKAQRCETVKEDPYGLGFGEAGARLLEAKGRFKPRRVDGQAVDGGQVEVSLHIWPHAERAPRADRRDTMLLGDPDWAAAPSFEEMAAAWPAGQAGEEAVVLLRCTMRPTGELERCRAINGAEKAVADAALGLSDRFRVRLTREEARFHAGWNVIVSLRLFDPASQAAAERRVTVPDWTAYPDDKALLAAYPTQATAAGLRSGRGVADCLVAADGSLTDCRLAGERPDGAGFGEAAVQVAGQMRLDLWSLDGRPTTGSRIRLPVEFNRAGP